MRIERQVKGIDGLGDCVLLFKLRQFLRLGGDIFIQCGQQDLKGGDFEFAANFEGLQNETSHCDHTEPHVSCCVSCKISYQSYVKVDVKHSQDSCSKTDSWFIEQLDLKSLKTLAKLKLEMENFTVKQLRELYRKSRVAIHANFTNNRHVHEEILREIEECKIVKKTEKRRKNVELRRASSLEKYKEVLKEFHDSHERLVDITQMKIEAEELHTFLMEKLHKTKMIHDDIVAEHSQEFKPRLTRDRKNSM